jgi:hypothetical protein
MIRDHRLKHLAAWDALGFKPWQRPQPRFPNLKKFLGFLLTLNFVSFMWILFRAESFDRAMEIFMAVFDWHKGGLGAPLLAWFIIGFTLFAQFIGQELKEIFFQVQSHMSVLALSLWTALWVIIIIRLGPEGVLPFIYFQY